MIYKELLSKYKAELSGFSKRSDQISLLRSIVGLSIPILVYLMVKASDRTLPGVLLIVLILTFLLLVQNHKKTDWKKKISKSYADINEREISFLDLGINPNKDGNEYHVDHTDFAYDLDFFGPNSLYQYLNRTYSVAGGKKLATILMDAPISPEKILLRQESIKELSQNLDWRQKFYCLSNLLQDNEKDYLFLKQWSLEKRTPPSMWVKLFAYLLPGLLFVSLISFSIFHKEVFYTFATILFFTNLGFAGRYFKDIRKEISVSDNLDRILGHYSLLLSEIEKQKFDSNELLILQGRLKHEKQTSSVSIKTLATIYNNLNSASNPLGATIFNGLFLFHLHAFINLRNWKEKFAPDIKIWLDVMGEIEALCSLANFCYNNPQYVFPQINSENKILFTDLGHPLIHPSKRICNDITFHSGSFYILTGSNMSGKSTFLRSLGINMILGSIGCPVCGSRAEIHPKKVLVSMRLSDSLSNAESYFYAEVKRLKYILDTVRTQDCFVLLDEILRGTNSEDKQFGTKEYIKQLVRENVLGIIATHDLEICNLDKEYPDKLSNLNFEVEIKDNDLSFDYKLRKGVCKSKSASFMMKKLGVI